MGQAPRDRLRLAVLVLVAFVLAHDLIFLITYGAAFEASLRRMGHGSSWTATVLIVATLAGLLVAAGAWRLAQLTVSARRLVPAAGPGWQESVRTLARNVVGAWVVILPAALVVFVGVENVEHVSAGLPLPGLTVLGSTSYHATLAIFGAVSLVTSIVDGLYRWRRDSLIARIAAAGARWARQGRPTRRPRLPWVDVQVRSVLADRLAGRAPPPWSATPGSG